MESATEKISDDYTEDIKRKWEIEKLKAETSSLQKPYWKQSSTWFTFIGLLISVAFNMTQCSKSQLSEERAEINSQKTKWETEKQTYALDSIKKESFSMQAQLTSSKKEFEAIQFRISSARLELDSIQNSFNKNENDKFTQTALKNISESLNNIEILTNKSSNKIQNAFTSTIPDLVNVPLAMQKEKEGFQDLINDDFIAAAHAFQASEDAYNGYHMVYELSRFLRSNLKNLEDPSKKIEILNTILNKYSKGAPIEMIKKLQKITTDNTPPN